jgi:hypothetical protein
MGLGIAIAIYHVSRILKDFRELERGGECETGWELLSLTFLPFLPFPFVFYFMHFLFPPRPCPGPEVRVVVQIQQKTVGRLSDECRDVTCTTFLFSSLSTIKYVEEEGVRVSMNEGV